MLCRVAGLDSKLFVSSFGHRKYRNEIASSYCTQTDSMSDVFIVFTNPGQGVLLFASALFFYSFMVWAALGSAWNVLWHNSITLKQCVKR